MSSQNIGCYEDLTKINLQLSSNIIKYAPYLFFWIISMHTLNFVRKLCIIAVLNVFVARVILLLYHFKWCTLNI